MPVLSNQDLTAARATGAYVFQCNHWCSLQTLMATYWFLLLLSDLNATAYSDTCVQVKMLVLSSQDLTAARAAGARVQSMLERFVTFLGGNGSGGDFESPSWPRLALIYPAAFLRLLARDEVGMASQDTFSPFF